MTAKIPGGFYIKARKLKESAVWKKPPHFREIWDLIIAEACHSGIVRSGRKLERGQCFLSYKIIQEELCWYVGYRKETYSRSQIEIVMKWLLKDTMITTTKTTRGMIVTVVNYDFYQDAKNYESHNETYNESHNEATMTPHYKQEGKEVKNVKKEIYSESFLKFWEEYPHSRRNDKSKCFGYWKSKKLKARIDEILMALKNHKASDQWIRNIIPNATTWLYQERWDQEMVKHKANPGRIHQPFEGEL